MDIKDLRGLMEAYSEVYAPEQLDEQGGRLPGPQRRAAQQAATERRNVAAAQAPAKPTGTGRGAAARYQAIARDKGAGGDAAYRAGGGDAAARGGLTRQQIQQKGMAATRAAAAKPAPTPAAKPAPTPAAKPATPAAKPATPAAKPSAAKVAPAAKPEKPAPGTKAAGPESIKPKTPNPLMQKTFGYQKGGAPDQVAKTAAATSKAASNLSGTGALKKEDFDLFDLVKGYLIDEGFAETDQAAIAIMANMSEEWKLEIIDEAVKGESSDRRRALASERRKGIKPLSAKEGEKYASHKISQMAHSRRARMGDDD